MAEEMQGIMALPEGQPQQPQERIDPTKFSPVIESYAKNSPREFNKDILGGIAEVDPAVADQFIRELAAMDLPPETIDALQMMVDEILSAPEDYQEDRKALLAEGVPEDLLPEQFDPAFFAAFNLALDQLELHKAPALPAVPAFADGGIINVKSIAREMAAMGRNGDTMLAHITPGEAALLRKRGGSGTINPDTGLPEFFFKKIFKGIGKAVKGVVKGLGKIVKSIANSTVGRFVLTMAAVYFMGPLAPALGITNAAVATAVNTFAGSTLVNLASGQKLGQALKGGIVAGATAGAVSGAMNYMSPPTSPAPDSSFTTPAPIDNAYIDSLAAAPDVGAGIQSLPVDNTMIPTANVPMPTAPTPTAPNFNVPQPTAPVQPVAAPQVAAPQIGSTPAPIVEGAFTPNAAYQPPPPPGVMDLIKDGKYGDAASAAYKNISPSEIQKAGAAEATNAYKVEYDGAIKSGMNEMGATALAKEAYKNALPGMLSKYGPMAAVGLGAAYLGGAFKPIPAEPPANMDMFKTTGADLLAKNPSKYGLNFGGTNTTYSSNPYDQMYSAYNTVPAPVGLAKGGIASLEDFPRKTGPISGPGTGTSDSVPAMLSDGEFVFTAKAVRAMGKGSRRKGAKRMYALMKQLEAKGK